MVALLAQQRGTGSCIPLPSLIFPLLAAMILSLLRVVLICSYALAEFLQAFNNLGLDQWTGIEMDVAWGHVTLQYGLHRPSITGPIFIYRVCASLQMVSPPWAQVLTHANLSPEEVLSIIAGHFPDLRDAWVDSTRGRSRDRSLMHPCYVLIHAEDYTGLSISVRMDWWSSCWGTGTCRSPLSYHR